MNRLYNGDKYLSRKRINLMLYRYKELKDENSFNSSYNFLGIKVNQLIKKVFNFDIDNEYFLDLRQQCFEKVIVSINKFKFKKEDNWFESKKEFVKYCNDNNLEAIPDVSILDYCLLQVYNCLKDLRRKYFSLLRRKNNILERLSSVFKKNNDDHEKEIKIDIDLSIDRQDNIQNKDIMSNIFRLAIEGKKNYVIRNILKLWSFNKRLISKCFSFIQNDFSYCIKPMNFVLLKQ